MWLLHLHLSSLLYIYLYTRLSYAHKSKFEDRPSWVLKKVSSGNSHPNEDQDSTNTPPVTLHFLGSAFNPDVEEVLIQPMLSLYLPNTYNQAVIPKTKKHRRLFLQLLKESSRSSVISTNGATSGPWSSQSMRLTIGGRMPII